MYSPPKRTVTVAAIGAMTAAIRAQRTLNAAGIEAEVVSLLPEETRRGCAFGIAFSTDSESRARSALRNARIGVSQYLRKDTT